MASFDLTHVDGSLASRWRFAMLKKALPIVVIGIVIAAIVGLLVASMQLELTSKARTRFWKNEADELPLEVTPEA
jgi:hypothetical protein